MKYTLFGKAILLFFTLTLSTAAFAAWEKTITTSPENAEIYVDGNLVGHGSYIMSYSLKDDFHVVKVKAPGYVEKEIKVYKKNKQDNVYIKLEVDEAIAATVVSDYANKRFTIVVRDDMNELSAWRTITQILLDYFPEMKTTDYSAGYMTTPHIIKTFPVSQTKIRNRVQVKQIINDDVLTFQVTLFSERSGMYGGSSSWQDHDRIIKELEPLINELQTRLGAKNI